MKYAILALFTLTLMSCEKEERFLTSGTWTIEKRVIGGVEVKDGKTKVVFSDGRFTLSNESGEREYMISGGKFYVISGGYSFGYDCKIKRNSMVVDCYLSTDMDIGMLGGPVTYLTK